eukprot:4660249-Alexandrium_andersonii.AAC.1
MASVGAPEHEQPVVTVSGVSKGRRHWSKSAWRARAYRPGGRQRKRWRAGATQELDTSSESDCNNMQGQEGARGVATAPPRAASSLDRISQTSLQPVNPPKTCPAPGSGRRRVPREGTRKKRSG